MKTDVKATPYLCVTDAARALEFYARAFGARETMRFAEPSGKIGHAEIDLGGASIMLSDEYPDHGARSPTTMGGTPVSIALQVPNVDAFVEHAVAAGAKIERPVADQFYGERSGVVIDPFGHRWHVSTHKEDVSVDEMQRRWADISKKS